MLIVAFQKKDCKIAFFILDETRCHTFHGHLFTFSFIRGCHFKNDFSCTLLDQVIQRVRGNVAMSSTELLCSQPAPNIPLTLFPFHFSLLLLHSLNPASFYRLHYTVSQPWLPKRHYLLSISRTSLSPIPRPGFQVLSGSSRHPKKSSRSLGQSLT